MTPTPRPHHRGCRSPRMAPGSQGNRCDDSHSTTPPPVLAMPALPHRKQRLGM
eukprot:CAMPEP_0180459982 /NCGR_PEP_ID=MMETSP1036_2-20121128/23132_1 /TAXON_ID=632150 /ORGANISM="Azadinium spinosum, Strain 3D9" /LENGTH=52 /DNA_ID=CAMNT_0022466665 /DNA_START=1043 /DNA_END=1204 /DNA_ORIENTATION=+